MDYGTSLLRETDIGSEIISNLRQQNVIADKVKTLEKSGELKTIQFYYFYTFIHSISIWNYSTKNIKYCYYIFLIIQTASLY